MPWPSACQFRRVRPGHLRTFSYVGLHRYFLTFTTDRRTPYFRVASVVDLVMSQFRRATTEEWFAILAYCFMPEHVHLLVEAKSEASDLLRLQRKLKQLSGYYYKQKYGRALWQHGWEHVLRDDEATGAVIRYIMENPIKGGLATRLEDYAFVGSDVYSLDDLIDFLQFPGKWEP